MLKDDPKLWTALRNGAPLVSTIEEEMDQVIGIYNGAAERRFATSGRDSANEAIDACDNSGTRKVNLAVPRTSGATEA